MQPTTRILRNTSKDDYNVVGVGEIPAGEQVSISTVYQPAIVLENYPGLVDITDVPGPTTSPAPSSNTTTSPSAGGGTTNG